MAVTKNIYMKKSKFMYRNKAKQPCKVPGCTDGPFAPQGLVNHLKFKHGWKKPSDSTGWQKVEGAPAYVKEPDTKGKITAAESTPMTASMLDIPPAAATEPWHYAILKDFEEAVRGHEMRGSSEFPEVYEEEYKRAKHLLALRFLLLKHRSEVADMLERELMN